MILHKTLVPHLKSVIFVQNGDVLPAMRIDQHFLLIVRQSSGCERSGEYRGGDPQINRKLLAARKHLPLSLTEARHPLASSFVACHDIVQVGNDLQRSIEAAT